MNRYEFVGACWMITALIQAYDGHEIFACGLAIASAIVFTKNIGV